MKFVGKTEDIKNVSLQTILCIAVAKSHIIVSRYWQRYSTGGSSAVKNQTFADDHIF